MTDLNVLFLGASKRVSLLERFCDSSRFLGINLNIFSCEKNSDFYPISHLATVIGGPDFLSEGFPKYLESCLERYKINIVIPNMDSAAVALSRFKHLHKNQEKNVYFAVSDKSLCEVMYNKTAAGEFFHSHGISAPCNTPGRFPKIVKPVNGFGSKGIVRAANDIDLNSNKEYRDVSKYLIQDLIIGQETTLDFYVSPVKGLVGYVLRDRLEVSDGEVMVCTTRLPTSQESELVAKLSSIPGWEGCITAQYIRNNDGINIVEVNPRFGGGATCSIEAGLNMPLFILSDYLGKDYQIPLKINNIKMTRARRDFFHEI